MNNRTSTILFALILALCATFAHSQVPVAIAPDIYPVYFGSQGPSAGLPLASGFLYTYQAGTTTQANTYIDSTGTVQNAFPIPLDANGTPSNGSVQTQIWLANQSYKFCAYNAAMVQQWCRDNIVGYLGLLNLANTWTLGNTFLLPITDLTTDNQMVFGSPGNQTTLDFPPPTGPVVLHFPNTSDTMMGRNTADTETNKSLTTPNVNGVVVTGVLAQNFCSAAPVTVPNVGNGGGLPVQKCTLPAGALNTLYKTFRFTFEVSTNPASNTANQISWGIAPTFATVGQACNQTTGSPGSCILQMTCVTVTVGSSGQLSCTGITGGTLTAGLTPFTTITTDLTGTLQVGSQCAFGVAGTNSCTGNLLLVEQLN